jgi:hypothetical protein
VERSYSWDGIGERMIATYLSLAGAQSADTAAADSLAEAEHQSVAAL